MRVSMEYKRCKLRRLYQPNKPPSLFLSSSEPSRNVPVHSFHFPAGGVIGDCLPNQHNDYPKACFSLSCRHRTTPILQYRVCGSIVSDADVAAKEAHFQAHKVSPKTNAIAATSINVG